MSKYRNQLPQLSDAIFLTDGGLETTLVFHRGMDLPCFAAFDLLKDDAGINSLRDYYAPYLDIARRQKCGFILEAPTWRANPDWAEAIGYDPQGLADANRKAIGLMLELREQYETPDCPMVISGNIGPRGDGYVANRRMTVAQARDYHSVQIDTFASTDADMVAALTLNYVDEAVGIVEAAKTAKLPVAISFTVETDGRLPDGTALDEAIARTDEATSGYTAYFMINCAHPSHFAHVLRQEGSWRERIRGLRANASRLSHAELDNSPELDEGNPQELGKEYRDLVASLPKLSVLGGCCGTDHRHLDSIAAACSNLTLKTAAGSEVA